MNVSNDSHSGDDPRDLSLPLWRRTQLRLQNMATFTAQLTPMSLGLDPVSQAMEDSIASLGRLLVVKLQKMEERQEANPLG
mgnify:CR=1 FL=1